VGTMSELVSATSEHGVGIVRLTDPAHRNALSAQVSDQLADRIEGVLRDGVGAVVLLSDPPVFCAGGSLDGLLAGDVPVEELYRGFLALSEAPVPTIAAVGGPAIGAGVNLALACDLVITSPLARFDIRFLDVGIHPGGGHLWRLQRRVGDQGAAALVLFGETLDGREAVGAGLAWRCVENADLESVAIELAQRAAERPRALVSRTKASLRASESILDPAEAFDLELDAQRWSINQPDFKERIRAVKRRMAE
jgi:enoyl-CoA hydratase